jgi:hypothetical protein
MKWPMVIECVLYSTLVRCQCCAARRVCEMNVAQARSVEALRTTKSARFARLTPKPTVNHNELTAN